MRNPEAFWPNPTGWTFSDAIQWIRQFAFTTRDFRDYSPQHRYRVRGQMGVMWGNRAYDRDVRARDPLTPVRDLYKGWARAGFLTDDDHRVLTECLAALNLHGTLTRPPALNGNPSDYVPGFLPDSPHVLELLGLLNAATSARDNAREARALAGAGDARRLDAAITVHAHDVETLEAMKPQAIRDYLTRPYRIQCRLEPPNVLHLPSFTRPPGYARAGS